MKSILIFMCLLLSMHTYCQRDFSEVEIVTTLVADNLYMLEGSGGNIGVFTGEDGVLMIDDQFAGLSDKIKTAMSDLSDYPVFYLLNTHWHGDHTGGNENFGMDGAIIVAQENVRKRMSTDQFNKAFNRTTKASPEIAWPQITYNEDMQIHFNDESILLIHVHDAHTDGDAFVYFPERNVIHMGDCFFNGRFPYIDLGSGGTVNGAIKAVQTALMLTNNSTKIIPGHGKLAHKSDLLKYYTMLEVMKDRVLDGMAKGQSIDDMKAGELGKGYEAWGDGFVSLDRFIDIIWTDFNREE